MAERERFELSRPLRAYGISSAAPSTELGDRSDRTLPMTALSPSEVEQRAQSGAEERRGAARCFDRATAPRESLPSTAGPTHPARSMRAGDNARAGQTDDQSGLGNPHRHLD